MRLESVSGASLQSLEGLRILSKIASFRRQLSEPNNDHAESAYRNHLLPFVQLDAPGCLDGAGAAIERCGRGRLAHADSRRYRRCFRGARDPDQHHIGLAKIGGGLAVIVSDLWLSDDLDTAQFAERLSSSHATMVDPTATAEEREQAGIDHQLVLRELADRPELDEEVLAALDPAARPAVSLSKQLQSPSCR